MAKVTDKQQMFVEEYVKDFNASQAAIRAGYSKSTARQIGSKLLTKINIQAEIARKQEEIAARNDVSVDYVIQSLKTVAERCMQAEPVTVKVDGEIKEVGEYRFDSAGANKALDLLGKHVGAWEKDNKQKSDPLSEVLAEVAKRSPGIFKLIPDEEDD